MKIDKLLAGLFFFLAFNLSWAQDEPLKIGTETFSPPFVTIGAGGHAYGFDADMMQMLCHSMKKTCQFKPMPFNKLIGSTARGEVDMAVSAIGITVERLRAVNFSAPYLIIYHRFLTRTDLAIPPFDLSALDNKRIAYEEGTILDERIKTLSIKNPRLRGYKHIDDEIVALSNEEVDFVILDNPTALYWENNASGEFKTFGDPLPSGVPLGIAVNPQNPELLAAVNFALNEFLNNGGFHATYNKYLAPFINAKPAVKANP